MDISVIIPAFQADGAIAKAVRSCLEGTQADFEVIIVADDGLDYHAVLDKAALNDDRLVFLDSPAIRSGPGVARNVGLKSARGRYIAPLDADDSFSPGRLDALLAVISDNGAVSDDIIAFSDTGKRIVSLSDTVTTPTLYAETLIRCGIPVFPLVARDVIPDGWPEDVDLAEDVIFNLTVISRTGPIPFVPKTFYAYCVHPDSITNAADSWKRADRAYGHVLERLEEGGYDLSTDIRRQALEGFTWKRAVNLAFGEAYEAGRVSSFQEFNAKLRDFAPWLC